VVSIDAQITFCYTRDLPGTVRFYEEVLELPLVLDQGGCRIYRTAENAYLGFCGRGDAETPAGVILTLVTDDVDAWHARLAERGVEFEREPTLNSEYGIYHCFFRDPNGYLLEIQRFDDPNWNRQ
jgi:catechol 2,3-dioxygenase-like lactoylglutathione lyase family enzyme